MDASQSRVDFDIGSLEPLLADAEAIKFVLVSTEGIERTTADRKTTIEPGEDDHNYAMVSDRRVYFLRTVDPAEAELALDLGNISSVDMRDGLLSSTLVVKTPTESVRFSPKDSETAERAASYISRIGKAWSDLFDDIESARVAIASVESSIADGEDPRNDVQRVRSRISSAYHHATHQDDAPTELMRAEIEPIEAELDRLRIDPRLDRIEELIGDVHAARGDGSYAEAVDSVVAAAEAVTDATSTLDGVDAPDASEELRAHAEGLDGIAKALLSEAESACHRALDADDAQTAVTAWEEALECYRATVEADWDGPAGASLDALQFQLAWIVGNLIDALAAHADEREAAGDDLGVDHDDALDHYETARDDLDRARHLAEEHPYTTATGFAERIDDLEEKIARSEWQWGAAG